MEDSLLDEFFQLLYIQKFQKFLHVSFLERYFHCVQTFFFFLFKSFKAVPPLFSGLLTRSWRSLLPLFLCIECIFLFRFFLYFLFAPDFKLFHCFLHVSCAQSSWSFLDTWIWFSLNLGVRGSLFLQIFSCVLLSFSPFQIPIAHSLYSLTLSHNFPILSYLYLISDSFHCDVFS